MFAALEPSLPSITGIHCHRVLVNTGALHLRRGFFGSVYLDPTELSDTRNHSPSEHAVFAAALPTDRDGELRSGPRLMPRSALVAQNLQQPSAAGKDFRT